MDATKSKLRKSLMKFLALEIAQQIVQYLTWKETSALELVSHHWRHLIARTSDEYVNYQSFTIYAIDSRDALFKLETPAIRDRFMLRYRPTFVLFAVYDYNSGSRVHITEWWKQLVDELGHLKMIPWSMPLIAFKSQHGIFCAEMDRMTLAGAAAVISIGK